MGLAATEIRDLLQGKACGITGCGTHGQGDQDLINVKTWVFASEIFGLQLLDRMDGIRRDHMLLMVNSSQFFQGIQKESCRCTEKFFHIRFCRPEVPLLQQGHWFLSLFRGQQVQPFGL